MQFVGHAALYLGLGCKISAKTADTMAFIDLQPTYICNSKLKIIVIYSARNDVNFT